MADFYFPQRGMFAVARAILSPLRPTRGGAEPSLPLADPA